MPFGQAEMVIETSTSDGENECQPGAVVIAHSGTQSTSSPPLSAASSPPLALSTSPPAASTSTVESTATDTGVAAGPTPARPARSSKSPTHRTSRSTLTSPISTVASSASPVPVSPSFISPPPVSLLPSMFPSYLGRGARYCTATALAVPTVQRHGDSEATVFAPINGKMIADDGIIDDYPPPQAGTAPIWSATYTSSPSPVVARAASPPPVDSNSRAPHSRDPSTTYSNATYELPRATRCYGNTAGAFDVHVAVGFIPLPSEAELGSCWSELYDPALTARGDQWLRCLSPFDLRRRFTPSMYLKLLRSGNCEDDDAAAAAESAAAAYARKIRKDLTRTFPSEPLFQTDYAKSVLLNVLSAYAAYDMSVGYAQGIAFIAGTLMLHFGEPSRAYEIESSWLSSCGLDSSSTRDSDVDSGASSEELIFWSFVQVMNGRKYNLRAIYADDSAGLRLLLTVLDQSLEAIDPELHAHLTREGVDVSLFASSWFLCVYSYRFPLPFASLVWDHFLNIGCIFLVQMAVQLLRHTRAALLAKSFEQLAPFLAHLPQMPNDLPDRAFAEVDIPIHLCDMLHPKQTTNTSFKNAKQR